MEVKKSLPLRLLVCCVLLLLSACSSQKDNVNNQNVLHWSEKNGLQTLDVSHVNDSASLTTLNNTMEGLYRTGKDSRPEPGVAYKVKISKNSMRYVFYLRNSQWSDGSQVEAKDFVYSWRRTVSPSTGAPYAYLFDYIKNGSDIRNGKKPLTSLGVKAVGKKKLIVTLQRRIPFFKELMGFPIFFPQKQDSVERFGTKYGLSPQKTIYNGPFKLTNWKKNSTEWIVKKNPIYWDKKFVKLDGVRFNVISNSKKAAKLFNHGKLDMALINDEKNGKKKNTISHKEAYVSYIEFNQSKNIFQNKNIRRGISLAINRNKLIKNVLKDDSGILKSAVPTGYFTFDDSNTDFSKQSSIKKAVRYKPKEARKIWEHSLDQVNEDSVSLDVISTDYEKDKDVANFVANQIESNLSNVQVNVESVPMKEFMQKKNTGNFDLAISSHRADFYDPVSFVNLFTSDNVQNAGVWQNAEFDRLVANSKFKDGGHPEERWNDLIQAESILMNEQGVVPLYQEKSHILLSKRVHGIVYNEVGIDYNFKHAFIKD